MHMIYIAAILGGVAALLVVFALVVRAKAKRILAAPVGKTGSAQPGPAGYEGVVVTNPSLVAPCSQKPCVYYEVTIEQKIKQKRGSQTSVSWKKVGTTTAGVLFQVDDGSGPLAIDARQPMDSDLAVTYSGSPQGGLGALQSAVTYRIGAGEEIVDQRVTERAIEARAKVFALGETQNGALHGGAKKLLVSTRGRDAMVGSAKKTSLGLFALGGVFAAVGAILGILRPGEARPCKALVDTQAACTISTEVVDTTELQPDGSKKPVKLHQRILEWTVTKAGAYELGLRPNGKEKRDVNPSIQVENSIGFPVNIGINWGLSTESANNFKTKTKQLSPGTYKIYAWSAEKGPDELVLSIAPLADKAETK